MDEQAFDYRGLLDELRCRSTAWLGARRTELVRAQRRLRVEELAVTAVLDERGALDACTVAADGVSCRTAEQTLQVTRRLQDLPAVAAAAHTGRLSSEQLAPVCELAEASTDTEWAARAPHVAPADLARLARTKAKPTAEDAARRREARELHCWWQHGRGMFCGRFALPDVDGALAEAVLNHLIDRMRPPKGQPWDTRAHRGADALVELCRRYRERRSTRDPDDSEDDGPSPAPPIHMVVHVPREGPAEIAGIPLPDAMVEALRAHAILEAVLVDDDGTPLAHGRARPTLSPKVTRAVLRRDGHCRWPGCTRRTGLQIHHLVPLSWGGTDDISNLAAVCVGGATNHHALLAPHGPHLLAGNPNRPDGLKLVRNDSCTQDLARRGGLTRPP